MNSILDAEEDPIDQELFSKFSLVAPVKDIASAKFFDEKAFEKPNSLAS